MESLQLKLKQYPNTFEQFRKWLWIKLKGEKKAFTTFFQQPLSIQCFFFLDFLESKSVPVLDALCYQRYSNQNLNFISLCYYTIIYEFFKLEKNIEPKLENYKPF